MYPLTHSLPKTIWTDTMIHHHVCFVAPATLYIFTKFQPWIPTQSKMALILSNSVDYPLPGLKYTQNAGALATLAHSLTYQCMKHHLKLLKIKVINCGQKKWGITSRFTSYSWPTCNMALPHVSRRQCHVPSSVAKLVIHVKNQPTYSK